MSIRDRVRRALRNKSDSSDASDSASQSDSSPATPVSSNSSHGSDSAHSLSSKLSRTFTWASRDKDTSSSSKEKPRRNRPLHPSERPLTAQNLRHQQMLNQFTMTFGTSNLSQLDLDGVSPCCTRAPSICDGLEISPGYSQHGRLSFSEDEIAPV